MNIPRPTSFKIIIPILALLLAGCESEESTPVVTPAAVSVNTSSIAPSSTSGRTNNYLGCIETSSRSLTYQVWDHGIVDGDIVSLIANGTPVLSNYTLTGTPKTGSITLPHNGFNYLVYFAHNLGDVAPNTAALKLGGNEQYTLEANLQTNGYVDIVVTGFGATCPNSGSSGSGGSGGGGSSGGSSGGGSCPAGSSGQLTVYSDAGTEGDITVKVDGSTIGTLTQYFPSGSPTCGSTTTAGYITRSLSAGSHQLNATAQSGSAWSGSFDITSCDCLTFRLNK